MKVLMATSEADPFARTGGLGDMVGMLYGALAVEGVSTDVILPLYASVDRERYGLVSTGKRITIEIDGRPTAGEIFAAPLPSKGVHTGTAYFIANDMYFDRPGLYGDEEGDYPDNLERFVFFSRAVLEAVRALGLSPDILHCHDWQTSLIPVYLHAQPERWESLRGIRTLLTIHNLAYQGLFSHWDWPVLGLDWSLFGWQGLEFYGKINLLKGGILFASGISTVSKTYSREIQTPEYGCGLEGVLQSRRDRIFGVVSGLDNERWDPGTDAALPECYSADHPAGKTACKRALQSASGLEENPALLLAAMVGDFEEQKGLDLILESFEALTALPLQIVILGRGARPYGATLQDLCRQYPVNTHLSPEYGEADVRRAYAGADLFWIPHRFEPCGTAQLIALRYGAVPVAHFTGGLADTVSDMTPEGLLDGSATGFVFLEYNAASFYDEVARAVALHDDPAAWGRLRENGMRQDWSFLASARRYRDIYERLTA
ncbi:MAG: glycogen/starch synthase [Planctomycetota bacterium]